MLVETLDEVIKVRADFTGGQVTPLLFKREGRVFRVRKVCARWEDRQRESRRCFFSVEAEGNIYEIHLDTGTMAWRLDRVCLNG